MKNNSFIEELKKSAYIWIGKCAEDKHALMLAKFNGKTHWIGLKEEDNTLVLYGTKETLALSAEIYQAIQTVFPKYKKYDNGKMEKSTIPSAFSNIIGDFNERCSKQDVKVLSEMTVKNSLIDLGVDITKYSYTKMEADNSHTVSPTCISMGYTNYDKEAISHMEDVSDCKAFNMEHPDMVELVFNGMPRALILEGPAGTGKSTEFKIACAQKEIPCFVIQFTANSQEDSFISSYVPNTEKDGPHFKLKRSPFTYAFQYGGVCILDEINFAHPNVLSVFNSAIDNTAKIVLDDGTEIQRHKDFRVVATLNPGYSGTNKLNPAFVDRFDFFYWGQIGKQSFISKLQAETGYKNVKFLTKFYEEFDKLRNIYTSRNMETEVTYRRAKSFLEKFLAFPNGDIQMYYEMAFINNTVVLDLNDINSELEDLKKLATESVTELLAIYKEGQGDPTEKSWTCRPSVELDDITSQLNEDGTFADLELEMETA